MHELQAGMVQARMHGNLVAAAMAIAVVLFLILGLSAIRQQVSFWWPLLPIPAAAISARRYGRRRQSRYRMSRLNRFYERAVQRIQGDWAGTGVTGEEFADAGHVYATDLHVLGHGSLFELLCIARTSVGRQGLADYLLQAPDIAETLRRQDAVRELRGRVDLRERVASLGEFETLESKQSTFEDWLNSPPLRFPRALPVLSAVTSALLAGLALAGLTGLIPWIGVAIWAAPLVAFHSAAGLVFRKCANEIYERVRPVSCETQVLRDGLQLLETEHFESEKLRLLAEQVRNGSESVRRLERLLNALNDRRRSGSISHRSCCWPVRNCAWQSKSGEASTGHRWESCCGPGRSSRR
jgi:hypothetical protein